MLEKYINIMNRLVNNVPMRFTRYLYDRISWDSQLVGIAGFRGTGKTILLLQHIKRNLDKVDLSLQDYLYVIADQPTVLSDGLMTIASEFFDYGGKTLLIDEVHTYPNHATVLKNIYDIYPDKKIIYSGSSSLSIKQTSADLSRRTLLYKMKIMSFREYLELKHDVRLEVYSMDDILHRHTQICAALSSKFTILKEFSDYLLQGSLPIFVQNTSSSDFWLRINQLIDQVVYEDIQAESFPLTSNRILLKQIIGIIASSNPFEFQAEKMASTLKVSKNTLYRMMDILELAEIITVVYPKVHGYRRYRKSSKVLFRLPNLYSTIRATTFLSSEIVGCIRESFFVSQIDGLYPIYYPKPMDFVVENVGVNYYFEIGGKNKSNRQLQGVDNGYLLVDGTEMGYKNRIPLYLMGFLY